MASVRVLRVLSVIFHCLAPIIEKYSSVILDKKLQSPGLWHLVVKKYFILAAMYFLVITRDGTVSFQCAGYRLCLRFCCVPFPSSVRF